MSQGCQAALWVHVFTCEPCPSIVPSLWGDQRTPVHAGEGTEAGGGVK